MIVRFSNAIVENTNLVVYYINALYSAVTGNTTKGPFSYLLVPPVKNNENDI